MGDQGRCEATQHDYVELERQKISENYGIEQVGFQRQSATMAYELARLFCRRCGWTRRVPELADGG